MLCCSLAGPEGDRAPRRPGRPPLHPAVTQHASCQQFTRRALRSTCRRLAERRLGWDTGFSPLLAVRVRHPAGEETARRREAAGLHQQKPFTAAGASRSPAWELGADGRTSAGLQTTQ